MGKVITHASTFSGIGAPEVAAAMLGWRNAFHCEINPFCREVLKYHFPNSKSYEDITKTDFSEWRGRIDVLTGGFPCQPFSYAGKRRGSEDDRYLWPYMLRCIEQIRPAWFIGENVAGITTMVLPGEDVEVERQSDIFGAGDAVFERRERYVLDEICSNLERAGYSVQPFIIPACAVGAPHRRDRVFIVAHRLTEDTMHSGFMGREHDEQGSERNIGDTGARSAERICEPQMGGACADTRVYASDPYGIGQPSCRRGGRERTAVDGERQDEPLDGAWRPRGGRASSDTQSGTMQAERYGYAQHHTEANKQPGGHHWQSSASLLPENRWRAFPSVSPVYRGNDGLSFDVARITIPFSRWRKESLKACGNAIVPQVMYEIFRAIEEIENKY